MNNKGELTNPYHFIIYAIGHTIIQMCIPISMYLFLMSYIKLIWFIFILINIFPMQMYYCEVLEYPFFGIFGQTKIPLFSLSTLCVDFILCSFIYFDISILCLIIFFVLGIICSIYKTIYCEKRDLYSLECSHVYTGVYRYIMYLCMSFGPNMMIGSFLICILSPSNNKSTSNVPLMVV